MALHKGGGSGVWNIALNTLEKSPYILLQKGE
jgi:hypothetical protein